MFKVFNLIGALGKPVGHLRRHFSLDQARNQTDDSVIL